MNAGFYCFGKNGYEKTSMADIAERAQVSKAALFHYFGTKAGFYEALFLFSCQEISGKMPVGTQDLIESLCIGTRVKFQVMAAYPMMYEFLGELTRSDCSIARQLQKSARLLGLQEGSRVLLSQVDWSMLRQEVSPQDALNLASWVSMGCWKAHEELPQQKILEQVERYLQLLKKSIYREECL